MHLVYLKEESNAESCVGVGSGLSGENLHVAYGRFGHRRRSERLRWNRRVLRGRRQRRRRRQSAVSSIVNSGRCRRFGRYRQPRRTRPYVKGIICFTDLVPMFVNRCLGEIKMQIQYGLNLIKLGFYVSGRSG